MAGGVSIVARIEDDGLIARFRAAPDKVQEEAKPVVREVSLIGVKAIKIAMPVDTGRARASWGVWSAGDLRSDNKQAKESDAVFQVRDDGLTVMQGTNVPYVEDLEKGSSSQQPAGFIEKTANAMAQALADRISAMLDGIM